MQHLHESIERWLIHENYTFEELKSNQDKFKFVIKNADAFGNNLEIFEPKQQLNTLVIGIKIPLKNNQMVRFLKLTQVEKENFEQKITDFCYSIKAVNKFFDEDGKKKVGVYVVLDQKEQLVQPFFMETLLKIVEMSDKTSQFLHKSF
ncbi:uncharacterized protein METZ01_LOCUS168087 [marine metagenome]|uniref:DUF2299 domain-containing protein n=1 Tax=marine metagenome TaxID=408172 RepID=A0A382BQ84_9ZZZZ